MSKRIIKIKLFSSICCYIWFCFVVFFSFHRWVFQEEPFHSDTHKHKKKTADVSTIRNSHHLPLCGFHFHWDSVYCSYSKVSELSSANKMMPINEIKVPFDGGLWCTQTILVAFAIPFSTYSLSFSHPIENNTMNLIVAHFMAFIHARP